jgi:thiamine biosynthesis lipoprotein
VTATTIGPLTTGLRRVVECMGTVFSFDVRTPAVPAAAVEEAAQLLHRIDATFSTYRSDSEVSRLDRGELDLADCSPDLRLVLDECRRLQQRTAGYFSAWATGSLDPSGFVKGWAIERASDLLRAHGSISHCVNGGGDVQCAGWAAVGKPWRIGIAHPLRRGELAAAVTGSDLAVATSGNAERGAHVIDPHTRHSPDALASITLVGRHLAEVDALATGAYAMGAGARDFIESLDGIGAFAVCADGSTWSTLSGPTDRVQLSRSSS